MEQFDDLGVDELRSRAEHIRQQLREHPLERPIFIEFSGTPKSGKSTCIDILSHFFRRLGFKVLAPVEGASKRTPYYLKDDLVAFNTWSASYALMHMLEGLHGADKYDVAILDRGLFDVLAWFELLKRQKQMNQKDAKRVQDFVLIDNWRSAVDGVFLFKTDPGTSLEREYQDKLIKETGKAMNSDFLGKLNDSYDAVQSKYGRYFSRLIPIDTSGKQETTSTSKGTAEHVARKILDIIDSTMSSEPYSKEDD